MRIIIAFLLVIAPSVSLAQASGEATLSALRACVRTHAPAARIAGILTVDDAIEYFHRNCQSELYLVGPSAGPVPPGSFRRVIRDEWTASDDQYPRAHQ